MRAVVRGEFSGGCVKAEHGNGPVVVVVDGVAHPGTDQGGVAEVE